MPRIGNATQVFKIRLASGRVVGPIDLDRIRLLILKNQIVGGEVVRQWPDGDWQEISHFPEIGSMLVAHYQGKLTAAPVAPAKSGVESAPTLILSGATKAVNVDRPAEAASEIEPEQNPEGVSLDIPPEEAPPPPEETVEEGTEIDDRTVVAPIQIKEPAPQPPTLDDPDVSVYIEAPRAASRIAQEKTILFTQRPGDSVSAPKPEKAQSTTWIWIRNIAVVVAVALAAQDLLFVTPTQTLPARPAPLKPHLPVMMEGAADPKASEQLYNEAMKIYVLDTGDAYRKAADKLLLSASRDMGNVKALAMLASSYLNLIDFSNKDENYFATISKLIELSRAKAVDLPETVIADVEFFLTVNKAEAAQNRVIEYTRTHQNFGVEMFFYLAQAFFARGDEQSAARYLAQIPDNKAYSPKIFFLRGMVAEKLGDQDAAMREYEKALHLYKDHAKSRLKIAEILSRRGQLNKAAPHLEFLVTHSTMLAPQDLARAYFLYAQLNEAYAKWSIALGYIERAIHMDHSNHDYALEYYTLKAREQGTPGKVQKIARMYYFVGEGERAIKAGNYELALNQFLEARQLFAGSALPLIKAGDMFLYLHDYGNARINYQKAADLAPQNIDVWSKYINVLIQSYEWEEAQKAMDKFRKLPVSQSAIDKAAGDLYMKQNRHAEAQAFYKKAMARDTIDPTVYSSYAKSLMATKNYKEAPFFFALALRFDPLNTEAVTGTAQCIAETESIDRGISYLRDQLQSGTGSRAEFLATIASLQIEKGDWDTAEKTLQEAMGADPDAASPWKVQAQIELNREGRDRKALDKALSAYKSYSDRNPSDPSGYLERYKIFIKKTQFEKAEEELERIYSIYPKYPNLHFYKGTLYGIMGNRKVAIEEFSQEIKNNPGNVGAMIALGKEYLEAGAAKEALDQFVKAMQLAPGAAEPKHFAGFSNYLLKNYQGAIALYEAAIALDPGNPLIYKRLGMAYRDNGDSTSARKAFRKYLEMEPDASDKAAIQQYL